MPSITDKIREAWAAKASGDGDRLDSALGELNLALREQLPEDPLVAATCLQHVSDPELLEELQRIAQKLESRQSQAVALVVTPEGRGHCVEILVDLAPGTTGVWCPQELSRDANLAAQLAAAVALGSEQDKWGVRWQLRGGPVGATTRLRGSSLGLAMVVAVRAARQGREVPKGWCFSAGVDLDGQLVEVSGLPAKIRAAEEAGHDNVALPRASRPGLKAPGQLELHGHTHFEAVAQQLWPKDTQKSARRVNWRWLMLLLPVVMAWTAFFDGLELWIRGPLMRQVLGELPAENAVVLALPSGDRKALRWDYPDHIDQLVEAGATSIGFDVLFLAESEADPLFAEAIEEARLKGVHVILPQRFDGNEFLPRASSFEGTAPSATVILEEDLLFGTVRRLPVRLVDATGQVRWSLSVALLASHLGVDEPVMQGSTLAVGVTRNQTHADRMLLPPVARPERVQWGDVLEDGVLSGKAVFIGVVDGHTDTLRTTSGVRYGVEVHAAAFETLARQKGLRSPSRLMESFLTLFVGVLSALFSWKLGQRRRFMAYSVGLFGLGAMAGALKMGLVFSFAPVLLACVLGVWIARRS